MPSSSTSSHYRASFAACCRGQRRSVDGGRYSRAPFPSGAEFIADPDEPGFDPVAERTKNAEFARQQTVAMNVANAPIKKAMEGTMKRSMKWSIEESMKESMKA